ncbi:dipeptide ABC transporter ATP-binding protein [Agromyces albus]|uniref:dipeptide ABC transporter ATP-binding protein n=1 Tax=Agromyces albus TaxID=205332 RepID=UPI002786AFD0|nr:ABC transporter ATP-binding protein [Agromyces albus]MDQ0576642.1 peptide/nickel transport system ATP-binding protein [Agromyces albus]
MNTSTTQPTGAPLLEISGVRIEYQTDAAPFVAADDVTFTIHEGEIFGLAGESGSGKSTIANAILGLLGDAGSVTAGSITFKGRDVLALEGEALRTFRWREIAMVFQSAMNSLNPVMTIGDQIIDVFTTHERMPQKAARAKALELLELVGIPGDRISNFPHQLSGGMRQRAVIATALALRPSLLIMDEPTTALDVVVQRDIMERIVELQAELGFSVLFITHDIALMVELAHRMAVMRHGRIVEQGAARRLYEQPEHAYTLELIEAFPPISSGRASVLARPADDAGIVGAAQATTNDVVLAVRGLTKEFHQGGAFRRTTVRAVDEVTFDIHRGEIAALVGESGSGKSTIARVIARLESADAGSVELNGIDVLRTEKRRASAAYRSDVQMVFQDPFGSLNPVHPVAHFLARPLSIHGKATGKRARLDAMRELMHSVGLSEQLLWSYPHQLSGGQRQRIAIARALAVEPQVILADEPTSMLDVSVRLGVLKLLDGLRRDRGISILYITHDLTSARVIADTTMVMYRGRIVERGPSVELMAAPEHPYTRLLISAVPDPLRVERPNRAARAELRAQIDQSRLEGDLAAAAITTGAR